MTQEELKSLIRLDISLTSLRDFSKTIKSRFPNNENLMRFKILNDERFQNDENDLSKENRNKVLELKRKFLCDYCNIIDLDILEKEKFIERL